MEFTAEYWSEVASNMPDWQAALEKSVLTSELREQYVHAHGVMLQAMGNVGATLVERKKKTWRQTLKKLRKIDWSRANNEWEGRALVHGRITKTRTNVILTGNLIKSHLGLSLSEKEQDLEKLFTQ